MRPFYGYLGKLESTTTQQFNQETGEWNSVILERWAVHKDNLDALIMGFRSGRNGYMMGSPPQIDAKGAYREVSVTFGPVKTPDLVTWWTSTSKGLVLNERRVASIGETPSVAAAAMADNQGLPGNGMQCTPQTGSDLVVCSSSWGPPQDEEDAQDAEAGKEIIDGITVNGVELSLSPTPGAAVARSRETLSTEWRKEVAYLNEIIAGNINQFPPDHRYHPNAWYRGSKYQRKDADIIEYLGTSGKWQKMAMELSEAHDMPYPSIQISVHVRTYRKKKQETLHGILSKLQDVGKLYPSIKIQDIDILPPQIKSMPAAIQAYDCQNGNVLTPVWKFNAPVVKTMGRGKWVNEKYTGGDGKTKTRRSRLYEYEYSYSYQSMLILYNGSSDPTVDTETTSHPGDSEDQYTDQP